jgi:hypothetical protein
MQYHALAVQAFQTTDGPCKPSQVGGEDFRV